MIKDLIKLSNHLDAKGYRKEADYLDAVINKVADEGEPATGARQIWENYADMPRAEAIKLLGGGKKGEELLDQLIYNTPNDPCKVREEKVLDSVISYVYKNLMDADKGSSMAGSINMFLDWLTGGAGMPTIHHHEPLPSGQPGDLYRDPQSLDPEEKTHEEMMRELRE